MASPPYAPIEEHIRGILQDVRLTPLERCAAIELYYHTDWNTRRLKCRGVIVAHIRRTLGKTDSTARRTKNKLEDLGFIQGDHFDASAWVRSEEASHPPPKMNPSKNGPLQKWTPPKMEAPPSKNGGPPLQKRTTPPPKMDPNTSLTSPSSLSLSNPSRPDTRTSAERRQAQEMRRREEEREKTKSGFMNGASLERIYRP